MKVRNVLICGAALVALAAYAKPGVAGPLGGVDPVNKSFFGGVALKGYDAVAYFKEGEPVKGSKEFQHDWMGAKWYFVSAANRDLFAKEPEKYAPQFGGYCAWAVSRGYTADIDPQAWKVVEGRLYLNYNKDVQRMWEQDVSGNIKKGHENWPRLRK
jgi:YHS domain-containing protein